MARRNGRNGRRRRRLLRWVDELSQTQRSEVRALLLLSVSILTVYVLYAPEPGWLGAALRDALRATLGLGAVALPALMGAVAAAGLLGRGHAVTGPRLVGGGLAVLLAAAFADAGGAAGGVVGQGVNVLLARALGGTGRAIVLDASAVLAAVLVTGASLGELVRRLGRLLAAGARARGRTGIGEAPAPSRRPAAPTPPAGASADVAAETGGEGGVPAAPEAPPDPAASEPGAAAAPPAEPAAAVPSLPDAAPPAAPAAGPFEQIPLATEALYQLPPLTLLTRRGGGDAGRRRDVGEKRRLLEQTLRNFGVEARVIDVKQGPAVTRFEVQPGPGVKVARIASLADDIALNLAAPGVRIVAPIPGKAALGIEVANAEVDTVYLRDVLESREFQQSPSRLSVAVGQDISGRPVVSSLERMVHLLVAGATGSGKSVFINSLLASLLFKATPRELRLLLIDPKVVELSAYNGIPHLLTPVITDPRRAAGSLKWLLKEMESRYEAFAEAGVRDIARYNQEAVAASRHPLPFIVVVIDELADLMMVAPAEVEDAIQRLAQMARAAGIHLVVATQRPSVDVITGVIKANIASRIAFAVSSQADSRTILDMAGAEKLLGKGDMLFHPMGAPKPVRVQGAYLPEADLEALLAFVRRQGQPSYREEVLAEAVEGGPERDPEDELFQEAVRVVLETGQASVSILQRRLRVGYSRAGRLIDMMEERGIVGPHQGSKPREIRISPADFRRVFGGGGGAA